MHPEGVKSVALLSPEYWNVGIVEYWEVITQNREMNVLQNGLMRFETHHSIIPLFQYSKDIFFRLSLLSLTHVPKKNL